MEISTFYRQMPGGVFKALAHFVQETFPGFPRQVWRTHAVGNQRIRALAEPPRKVKDNFRQRG